MLKNHLGLSLSHHYCAGNSSDYGVLFLHGFYSDCTGSKALLGEAIARDAGLESLRFDYSGHGESEGDFNLLGITDWLNDAKSALAYMKAKKVILVGSSMGGWLALLLAKQCPARVSSLVLIAPAPDFTEEIMWASFDSEVKKQIFSGIPYIKTDLSDSDDFLPPITRVLIEQGRAHLILREAISLEQDIQILQGMGDKVLPWRRSVLLAEQLDSEKVTLQLVKGAGHRFSRESDLALLQIAIEAAITRQ